MTIAVELEHISLRNDLSPVTIQNDISPLLKKMSQEDGARPGEILNGLYFGMSHSFGNITLEPGCQIELSSLPRNTLSELKSDLDSFIEKFQQASEGRVHLYALSTNPLYNSSKVPLLPKPRYHIMNDHFPLQGTHGREMMRTTASVQVCLDYRSLEDLSRRMRLSLRTLPFIRALFAASPVAGGRDTGLESYRHHIWLNTDNQRSGFMQRLLHRNAGIEDWLNLVLDMPPMFVKTPKGYQASGAKSFFDAIPGAEDREDGLDLLDLHVSQCFAELRFKQWMEFRTPDLCPPPYRFAPVAMLKGMFYDDIAIESAEALLSDIKAEEIAKLWSTLARDGLETPFRKFTIREIANEMLEISYAGLSRQNSLETSFLDEFCNLILEDKLSVASWMRHRLEKECRGSIEEFTRLFRVA